MSKNLSYEEKYEICKQEAKESVETPLLMPGLKRMCVYEPWFTFEQVKESIALEGIAFTDEDITRWVYQDAIIPLGYDETTGVMTYSRGSVALVKRRLKIEQLLNAAQAQREVGGNTAEKAAQDLEGYAAFLESWGTLLAYPDVSDCAYEDLRNFPELYEGMLVGQVLNPKTRQMIRLYRHDCLFRFIYEQNEKNIRDRIKMM